MACATQERGNENGNLMGKSYRVRKWRGDVEVWVLFLVAFLTPPRPLGAHKVKRITQTNLRSRNLSVDKSIVATAVAGRSGKHCCHCVLWGY